jgi:hypothetical protein
MTILNVNARGIEMLRCAQYDKKRRSEWQNEDA